MMNNNHLRTHSATETTGGGRWTSHVDVLNSVMDPIDVLSDADLQSKLSLFANAQFTFDTIPGVAIGEDKPESVSSFDIYRQTSSHSNSHHPHQHQHQHQQQQQHPLSLDIHMPTNGTLLNDAPSSTLSSPYDQRQHYFSPLSSLPTTPTKMDKHDDRQLDPFLSFMMLSTDQQQERRASLQQDPHHQPSTHHLNTSLSTVTSTATTIGANHSKKKRISERQPGATLSAAATRKKSASTTTMTPRRRAQSTPTRQHQKEGTGHVDEKKKKTGDLHDNDNDDDGGGYGGDDDYDEDNHDNNDDADGDDLIKLDKRRRNTAASARFRIKKKMREQSLQRTAYEMTEKAKVLENRVHELEREVKWLKDLIVAKNGS